MNMDNIKVNNTVNTFHSVAVYAGYIVTEHEGNMNMGQYYS